MLYRTEQSQHFLRSVCRTIEIYLVATDVEKFYIVYVCLLITELIYQKIKVPFPLLSECCKQKVMRTLKKKKRY